MPVEAREEDRMAALQDRTNMVDNAKDKGNAKTEAVGKEDREGKEEGKEERMRWEEAMAVIAKHQEGRRYTPPPLDPTYYQP